MLGENRGQPSFYAQLPLKEMSITELLASEDHFEAVPSNWHVVITDIRKSTQAVKEGLYQIINLVATGSIIAVLNIARKNKLDLPFFFGGDGATFILPPQILKEVMTALSEHQSHTQNDFQLQLRIGSVPVSKIYQSGKGLKIAKLKMEKKFSIPVVLGNGLKHADQLIKKEGGHGHNFESSSGTLDLDGMECRWNAIKPPKKEQEVLCLLIQVPDENLQAPVFKKVLESIDQIYGAAPKRSPIALPQLKVNASLRKVYTEMKAKLGRFDLLYLIQNWFWTFVGKWYYRYHQNQLYYLRRLCELCDTLSVDGSINTVISGTTAQRESLLKELQQMENDNFLIFGWHVSPESIISCYVRDRLDQHIHFVDGVDGGYTQAAIMLKGKRMTNDE